MPVLHVATVVREYSESDTHVCVSEQEALEWLTRALYLVQDGILTAESPTPSLQQLHRYASDYGWTIDLTTQTLPN